MRLGEILQDIAKQQKLELLELEMYTQTPTSILATALDLDEDSEGYALRTKPFEQYVRWLLNRGFGGSCGATSSLLDEITSRPFDKYKGTLITVDSGAFLQRFTFGMFSKKRSYCRVTLKVHSFFIEVISQKVVVYQSYFGHYPLARSIVELKERSRQEFMPLLKAAVHHDTADDNLGEWQECTKKRKILFLGSGPYHDIATVDYRINTTPATKEQISKNILVALKKNKLEWDKMMRSKETVNQLLSKS